MKKRLTAILLALVLMMGLTTFAAAEEGIPTAATFDELVAAMENGATTVEITGTISVTGNLGNNDVTTEKGGIVGAFCKVFSIDDAIDEFLPDKYSKCSDGRYTYLGGSTSGGLVVYDNGKFAFSHHSTDPTCGKLCNAFDLVRIHLFGDEDENTAPNTPATKLPSYKSMCDKALSVPAVQQELKAEQLSSVVAVFDDAENTEWVQALEINPRTGKPAATVDNVFLILTHDPRLKGRYYYDEFRARPIVCGALPWDTSSHRVSASWLDTDDAGLRWLLERDYKIDSAPKVRDAVDLAIDSNKIHPVRDYLHSLEWDGQPRAEMLFIDYLGAEDSRYTRAVTRKALIGAVARILRPGCKHDHMLVLVGPQGCRKSTTLAKLGKQWFSDSLYTMTGKDAYEQLQGNWIIELAEMAATRKAEIEQIKQFVSKQEDTYRAAYARRTQSHPRQCAFFGTTNDDEFLRDPTGVRRFWPVTVTKAGCVNGDKLTPEIVDQIWAEVVTYYDNGETWYLDNEVEEIARKVQSEHTETNGKLGLIENFIETLLPAGWDTWDLDRRLMFWSGGFGPEQKGTMRRTRVCALEIWQELFKGDPKNYTTQHAREITAIFAALRDELARITADEAQMNAEMNTLLRASLADMGIDTQIAEGVFLHPKARIYDCCEGIGWFVSKSLDSPQEVKAQQNVLRKAGIENDI